MRVSGSKLFVLAAVVFLGAGVQRAGAQTGPDLSELRKHEADAAKVRAAERAKREAVRAEEEKTRDVEKKQEWKAAEDKRVEAILATRPSLSHVQELEAEVARLKAELDAAKAQLKLVTEERDLLKKAAGPK